MNNKMKENDIVITKVAVENIPVGTIGTIIYAYKNKKAFEVEFIKDNSSIIKTTFINEIKKY